MLILCHIRNDKMQVEEDEKALLSLLLIGMVGCAKSEIVEKYEFPITVKSEEWNELRRDEKVKMCQIPEDIL